MKLYLLFLANVIVRVSINRKIKIDPIHLKHTVHSFIRSCNYSGYYATTLPR